MKTALIAGASGLVGRKLLEVLLESDYYDKIIILVRKKLPIQHSKLHQFVFDFETAENKFPEANDVYCCLGTTIKKAGSKEEFRKVDLEYPLRVARVSFEKGARKFAIVSSMGSDENSIFFYNQVKDEAERGIREIPFETTLIVRPSLLLGKRDEFRMGEVVGKFLMWIFGFAIPKNLKAVDSQKVARCMFTVLKRDDKGIVVKTSGEIQRY